MLDAFVVSVSVALVYAIHSMVYDALSYFAHVNKVIVKVPLTDKKQHITLYFLLSYSMFAEPIGLHRIYILGLEIPHDNSILSSRVVACQFIYCMVFACTADSQCSSW